MFTIVGFFMLKDGNQRNNRGHACYITAISTLKSPNIPAELYAFSAAGDTFFPDHTIVFAIGKVFYPPPGDPRPVIIDTLEIAPLPGSPSSDTYIDSMPNFRHPAMLACGTVSSAAHTVDNRAIKFSLMIQDYI
ncbi:hypothetical protein DFH94DRAFT_638501 [Russula ochroleuca]|uniref:Uncharacterized protein n=1 Tax=Russula ochroleuca TaxID=152965 RepID=A0A9P5JXS5_9AGAM|nr:hypothetical protein DFH94DRAFT_638501 [Russula ochroleuca]